MSNPILDVLMETTVLCAVSTKKFGNSRTDKAASKKANDDHGAAANAGSVKVKRLADADALHKLIASKQTEAVEVLKSYSQPFGDEPKWRLTPNASIEVVVGKLNTIKQEHDKLVQEVNDKEQEIIDMATRGLGKYDVAPPQLGELADAYQLQVDFRPIPDSANFRGINQAAIEKLRAMHDARLEAAVYAAERNTLERFVEPVTNFIEGIKRYEERLERQADNPEDKSRDGIFRDTLLTNITDLHAMLGSFNISGDARLTELGNQLASFAKIEPKRLREDSVIRSAAADRAREVAANLNSWLRT